MTEKELRKLSRVELLKLLVEVTEENEVLRAQLQGQQELVQRAQIQDSQEVRDSVEDVFRTVESTATGFLSKAQGIADRIMEDARVRAEGIIRDAEAQAARKAAYEPFTAAAPEMQQVIKEIALEQSPQQSAENAFETDALFEGTNATEVTAKRLTEVRVTEPAPLAAEPEEEAEEAQPADGIPEAVIAGEAAPEDSEEPEDYIAAEPKEAAAPEAYEAQPAPPAAAAVYPEQIVPQEDSFRIEGLEDAASQAQAADEAAAPQEKPLTAIDMLKRLQGGGS